MSTTEVKEIVYHCDCRRFVQGTPVTPCTCHECGKELAPTDPTVLSTVYVRSY
jgi:hypothetical protein